MSAQVRLPRLPWGEARAFWRRAAEEAERMSVVPAHLRPVVWAIEPGKWVAAELGPCRVLARVVSLSAGVPTSVAVRAG